MSHFRVSAAVNFKNFVKRNWRVIDDADKIPAEDRIKIKTMIVDLMISMPGRWGKKKKKKKTNDDDDDAAF